MQRLQKFLASAGFGSRRKSEEIIKQGRVRLNDAQAKLGDKVDELDKVYVDGNLIESICLLYTSPSPRDYAASRMPSSA